MIKKIILKGFRKHQKKVLKFSAGVNSIIGENAAGKSTILRAIKYVAMNKPSGLSVIHWDSDKASVTIFEDENKIKRIRSKSKNIYILNKKIFKAFAHNVPKEIQQTLGLSDINFQTQHQAPFWFSKTAGEVSRELNMIVNLDIIDQTLSDISSDIHKTKVRIETSESRLKELRKQKKIFQRIEQQNKDLKTIESLKNHNVKETQKITILERKIKSGVLYREQAESLKFSVSQAVLVLTIAKKQRNIEQSRDILQNLVDKARNLSKILNRKVIEIDSISVLYDQIKINKKEQDSLKKLIGTIQSYKVILCPLKEALQINQKRIKQMVKNKCPLCGKKS